MKKVFELAKKIKEDAEATKKDYGRDIVTKDFMDGVLASMQITLEDMEDIWDINLSEFMEDIWDINLSEFDIGFYK